MNAISSVGIAAGVTLGGWLAWKIAYLARCLRVGRRLAARSVAFERRTAGARGSVLVLGDSTGVGTGACEAADSVAGCLASEWPALEVRNRACVGARVRDTLAQLRAEDGDSFAAILVHVGGNDVLRGTPLAELRVDLAALLAEASGRSPLVVLTGAANVGLAPPFFFPLSWILAARGRALRDLYDELAARFGALHVDFFHERSTDPFSRDADRYYAADRFHPSSAGYRAAYEAIRSVLQTRGLSQSW